MFSHGTSNSRGVATLFPPNLDFNILEKFNEENGRFILLKCIFEEDQLDFINFLKSHINKFDTENIIMGATSIFILIQS